MARSAVGDARAATGPWRQRIAPEGRSYNGDMDTADEFTAKWHARWPEWGIGAVFLPSAQRATAFAWFALLQELAEAAWSGADATPGLAKLAWWNEELRGWAKGARRHPLGGRLQSRPAPWATLAAGLPALQASRERPVDAAPADAGLEDFARAVEQCERRLFAADGGDAAVDTVVFDLLGERLLLRGDADGARDLPGAAPAGAGASRARRLHSAFLRQRLQRLATGDAGRPPAPWRTLWLAWRTARST